MKKVWFKAKRYGWGWYPSTWQGWLVILLFILAEILLFKRIDAQQHSGSDTLINFVPATFILASIVIAICYIKGEKPGWRWGN